MGYIFRVDISILNYDKLLESTNTRNFTKTKTKNEISEFKSFDVGNKTT